ncbi:hypothetical protein SSX86_002393 [Deinandra increscens subsp. villosa]|uniref:RRM domain-containing protein n=1 Tax=Deinandra increscens subsp. villosa TaxID=3103831 RepID=A0AAP0DP30_9ASTR
MRETVRVENEWTVVRRRNRSATTPSTTIPVFQKHNPFPNATSFLLSNLPDECTPATIWRKCSNLGTLRDVFIPSRRDRRGCRYGFVRFDGIKNTEAMLQKLNEVPLGSRRHIAVLSNSSKRISHNHQQPPLTRPQPRPHHNPLPTEHRTQPAPPRQRWAPIPTSHNLNRPHTRQQISYRDITSGFLRAHKAPNCKDAEPLPPKPQLEVTIPTAPPLVPTTWKSSMLVGEAIDIHYLIHANTILEEEYKNLEIHYAGGLQIIIKFDCSKDAKNFLNNQRHTWSKVFQSLYIWEGQRLKENRVAQLIIRGVPFYLRCQDTYDEIGKKFGEVLESADFDWTAYDVTTGTCYVLTERLDMIQECITLKWNNEKFKIWIGESAEQWLPPTKDPSIDEDADDTEEYSSLWSLEEYSNVGNLEDDLDPPDTISGKEIQTPALPEPSEPLNTISGNDVETPMMHGNSKRRSPACSKFESSSSLNDVEKINRDSPNLTYRAPKRPLDYTLTPHLSPQMQVPQMLVTRLNMILLPAWRTPTKIPTPARASHLRPNHH